MKYIYLLYIVLFNVLLSYVFPYGGQDIFRVFGAALFGIMFFYFCFSEMIGEIKTKRKLFLLIYMFISSVVFMAAFSPIEAKHPFRIIYNIMIILKNEQYKNLTYLESDNKDEYYFASKYYFFNKIKPEKAFLLGFQRNESIEKYLLVYIISGKFYDTYNNPVKLNLKNGETSINGFSFELNTSNIKPRNFQSQISDVENCAPNCSTLYIMSDGREIRVDEILFSTEPRYVEEEFLIYKIEQTLVSMCM